MSARLYNVAVQVSGGAASYVAAKFAVKEFGPDQTAFVFADTLIEDEDLYRFLRDTERTLDHPIIRICEGRTPWQVFFDEKMMGSSRADPCSRILKRELLGDWRLANCVPDCTVIIGFDANERHRLLRLAPRLAPATVRAPLIERGLWKEHCYAIVEADGIALPRLYGLGFPHNNCGGFCVKAGHATFAKLLENFPERFAAHERKESQFRALTGKDVSIMSDRSGDDIKKPLTMQKFREHHERSPTFFDRFDLGGCNCMDEPEFDA